MNGDFDIDNILAEIKTKKDTGRAEARTPQKERGGVEQSALPRATGEVRQQRAEPTVERLSQQKARTYEPRTYEEYEPIRPARRKVASETQYEPASAIFALAEEYGESERPTRPQRTQREVEPLQERERPTRPQRTQREVEPLQERERPTRPQRTQREAEPMQERERPTRPQRTQREVEPMQERERPTRPQRIQREAEPMQEQERPTRPQRTQREVETRKEVCFEYEAEYIGDEAFGAKAQVEAPSAKRGSRFGRRKEEPEDDFMAKFSQVTPLGSRKLPRIDRNTVRSHFGDAEPIAPKELKPRGVQRAAEYGEQGYEDPAERVKRFSKPELKGGFRMEPQDYDRNDDTRLDLPISVVQKEYSELENSDDTRDMPLAYELEAEYPPDEFGDELIFDDQPPHAMPLDEYEDLEAAAAVRGDLNILQRGLMVRMLSSAICFLLLLYLGLSQSGAVPAISFLSAVDTPFAFAVASTGLLVLSALVCHSTISGGMIALFTLKANHDSLAALATLACVMQGVAVILTPEALGGIQLYACVAAAGLFFNSMGKLFTLGRINGNFFLITANCEKYTVQKLSERELGRELTWDMNIDEAHVAYSTRTDFVEGFIEQSYASDTTDGVVRITAPIIFVASIAVAVFSYVLGSDIFMALSVFAAVLSIASPFTEAIVCSLPLHKAYRALSRRGAMLSGYNAVERFAETNVVLADACDLFTSNEVQLHNIKTFAKTRIDDAILDAASVLCMCNGAVKNIFLRIIQGNTKMLKCVENVVYEDGMGISAWVSGKRVLIGNSDLMKHHGIDTPSRDYEAKYRTEERDILYLANSGELTAMFVISYVANREVDEALCDLERKGISVVVRSVDPNLTAAKIARIYNLPEEMVRMLPGKLHGEYEILCGAEFERDTGYIAHDGTFLGFARAVSAAGAVRVATNIGLIVQTVGMVLGYALVAFFSFMGAMNQAGVITVLVFQAIWSVAVWMFSCMRKI